MELNRLLNIAEHNKKIQKMNNEFKIKYIFKDNYMHDMIKHNRRKYINGKYNELECITEKILNNPTRLFYTPCKEHLITNNKKIIIYNIKNGLLKYVYNSNLK
jgi:hypothetical protein